MRRTVALGEISLEGLGGSTEGDHLVLGRSLTMVIRHYLASDDQTRPPLPPASFRAPGSASLTEVEFRIEERVWDELADEAARQQVDTDDLLRHAVLIFIADRDAGRISRPKVGSGLVTAGR